MVTMAKSSSVKLEICNTMFMESVSASWECFSFQGENYCVVLVPPEMLNESRRLENGGNLISLELIMLLTNRAFN